MSTQLKHRKCSRLSPSLCGRHGPRKMSFEAVECRQLMAADLTGVGDAGEVDVAESQLAPIAYVATEAGGGQEASGSGISNGLRPQIGQVAPPRADVDRLGDSSVILETTRPKDDQQLASVDVWEHAYVVQQGTSSTGEVYDAIDRVFAEMDVNADSPLSDAEREKWEQLILETLKDLEDRLEVRWQYADGEGEPVTESFGPHTEWPI